MSVLVSDVVAGDCIAVTFPLAFGASAVTLFSAWFIGATPCFYDLGRRGVDGLVPWLREHEIVQVMAVPSVSARAIVDTTDQTIDLMKNAWMGGEAVLAADVALISSLPQRTGRHGLRRGTKLGDRRRRDRARGRRHHRGPRHVLDRADPHVVVVDDDGNEFPEGEAGEVMVSGPNVAHGYWGDPPEYAGVYSTAPDGTRRVRLADRGRLLPDGRLQLPAGPDHRIKVRGQSVDLLMIEARPRGARPRARGGGLGRARTGRRDPARRPRGDRPPTSPSPCRRPAPRPRRRHPELRDPDAVPRFADALPRTGRDKVDRGGLAARGRGARREPVEYVAPR